MKIFVTAKPNVKQEKIEQLDKTHFIVAVKEPPVNGRANAAIIRELAEFFNISASSVQLVSGFSSKQKVFDIKTFSHS